VKTEGRGNDGLWTTRKTKPRFPSLPTALGNRCRDSHISTAPATVPPFRSQSRKKNFGPWKSGNRKARFPLSHRPDSLRRKVALFVLVLPDSNGTNDRKEAQRVVAKKTFVQAHSSMRICSDANGRRQVRLRAGADTSQSIFLHPYRTAQLR
jgi:hypothetical protein